MNDKDEVLRERSLKALHALDAMLAEATTDGVRDLHEALQIGKFAGPHGKATLVQGDWGRIGPNVPGELSSGCVLTALFICEARVNGGGIEEAASLSEKALKNHPYTPADFYSEWDAKRLSVSEVKKIVELHLNDRVNR